MGDIDELYGGAAFPAGDVEPASGFDAIPAGWYPVQVEAAEVCDTKAGTGKYLKVELTVIESPKGFAGRKLFPKLNLINPNQKAMEIGQRELAGLAQACGVMALSDTSELIGKIAECRVKVTKSEQYGEDNEVTAYRQLQQLQAAPAVPTTAAPVAAAPTTAAPVAPVAAAAPAAPTTAAPAAKRPWER